MEKNEVLAKRAFDALDSGPKEYKSLDYIKYHGTEPAFQWFMKLLFVRIENINQLINSNMEKRVGPEMAGAINDVLSNEIYKVDDGVFCNIAYSDSMEELMDGIKKLMKKTKAIVSDDGNQLFGVDELD